MKNPAHPIINSPHLYEVVDFHYHRSLDDIEDRWIDLILQKEKVIRRLRFLRPQTISIKEGFPLCPGFYISDLSMDGLEDIKVRVDDFEAGPGGISFWAAAVIDLDEQPPQE